MNRKHVLAVGIGIASMVGVATLVPAKAAPSAQGALSDGPLSGILGRRAQDVKVTNTASEPVPVTAAQSGPWTVGINGTVPVAGAVAVTNTPAVTLSGTPTVKVDAPSTVELVRTTGSLQESSGTSAFHSFDTAGFGSVRIAWNAFSGTTNCDILVFSPGAGSAPSVTLEQWKVTTDTFEIRSAVFETPADSLSVGVHTNDKCLYSIAAWGRP